jgi:3-oxoacyl-[acyl-carrier-protein] synthase III
VLWVAGEISAGGNRNVQGNLTCASERTCEQRSAHRAGARRELAQFQGEIGDLRDSLTNLLRASGTQIRYQRARTETALELGIQAGETALQRANLAPGELDLLLYVGVGRGFVEPATCNVFIDALGTNRATGFDILDACASWMRALQIARSFISQGHYRNVLVLNAEFNVRDYARYEVETLEQLEYTFPAFTIGEAATAAVLSSEVIDEELEYYADFRTAAQAHDLCKIPLPRSRCPTWVSTRTRNGAPTFPR